MWGEGEYPHPVDGVSVEEMANSDRAKKLQWLLDSIRSIEQSGAFLSATYKSAGNCLQQLSDYTGRGRPFFGKPRSVDIEPLLLALEESRLIERASMPAGNGKTRDVWKITR